MQNIFSYLLLGPITKNRKCSEWPQHKIERYKVKCTSYICKTSTRDSQISLHFALRSLVFQITEFVGFSIGYNGEFEIFENKIGKNRKRKISKIQNGTFVKTTEKKIQKKVENIQKWL